MAHVLDEIDVIKNIEQMYESNNSFSILMDFERILDELNLYVYKNWMDGEIVEGPRIDRHWISAKFMWPYEDMPDPSGAKRLTDYDCKVVYTKGQYVKPRKILDPNDIRPGTKKGKLDKSPVWIVGISIPLSLISSMSASHLEDMQLSIDDYDMATAQTGAEEPVAEEPTKE